MISRLIGIAVLSAIVACASSGDKSATENTVKASPTAPASATVLRGEELFTEGKFAQARSAFEEAIADDPEDKRAWLDMGLVSEQLGDWDAAEQAYRRAIEIDPNFVQAINNLGVLVRERGNLVEAATLLERAVEIDPGLVSAYFNLALTYEDQGRFGLAEDAYLSAIGLMPNDAISRINLGLMYVGLDKNDKAAEQLNAAIPLIGSDVALSIAVGEGLRRAQRPDQAQQVLERALAAAGDSPPLELLAELSLVYFATDRIDKSEALMRRAAAQDPRDPALQYALAAILLKQHKELEAKKHFQKTIDLAPSGPYAGRARTRLEQLAP